MSETIDRHRAALVLVLSSVLLVGCGSLGATTDEKMGSLVVAPGKYQFYNCAQLAQQSVAYNTREKELEALIIKAGPDAGGRFVSAIAYQTEYTQARGNLVELRKAEADKNCPPAVVEAPAKPAAAGPKPKKQ